jgi:DNA-binding transcriptional LysR family regulator
MRPAYRVAILIYPKARELAPRVRALVDYLRATIRLE